MDPLHRFSTNTVSASTRVEADVDSRFPPHLLGFAGWRARLLRAA